MSKRKPIDNRLDNLDWTRGALAVPLGLRVEVHPVEHLDPPPHQITEAKDARGEPDYPWAGDPGGVFVVQGYLRRRAAPPPINPPSYDAALRAEELLIAVTALDVNDDAALLAFVNNWGLLECAKPPRKHVDSVAQTRATLAKAQRLTRWLSALQHKRWRSKICPTLREIGFMVGEVAENSWVVPRKAWPELQAAAFALALTGELGDAVLHPVVTAPRLLFGKPHWLSETTGKRLDLVVSPERLSHFLYLDLARRVRLDTSILRPCKGCPVVFPVAPTNTKKRYHDVACKNRRAFKSWYSKPRNRKAHNARRRSA
jgi:hypothetical protein